MVSLRINVQLIRYIKNMLSYANRRICIKTSQGKYFKLPNRKSGQNLINQVCMTVLLKNIFTAHFQFYFLNNTRDDKPNLLGKLRDE